MDRAEYEANPYRCDTCGAALPFEDVQALLEANETGQSFTFIMRCRACAP